MNQCVPSWDADDHPHPHPRSLLLQPHQPSSGAPNVPVSESYEVAELTWENGNVAMHGLGHPRIGKPVPKYPKRSTAPAAEPVAWDKPRQSGTLESVVDQATRAQLFASLPAAVAAHPDLPSWLRGNAAAAAAAGVDALVPCAVPEEGNGQGRKRARVGETGRNCGSQGSAVAAAAAALGKAPESTLVTLDPCGDDAGFTTTSPSSLPGDGQGEDAGFGGSPETENTSFGYHDSVCHSWRSQRHGEEEEEKGNRAGQSSISTKRSRAAAIHNQSERKRRDRINQKMKALQKLVPNSSKTDKASMLDEVIDYLKQLQAQIQLMSRMNNFSSMMMPMAPMQLLQQMSLMANMAQMAQMSQMSIGMRMADLNPMNRTPGQPAMPHVLNPSAFFPLAAGAGRAPWDGSADRMQERASTVMPDPYSTFLPYPSQQQQQQQQPPMDMDVYSRMTALYQQLYQQPLANPKT